MQVGKGEFSYEWIDNWAEIPDPENARRGWAHHGVVVTETGDVIVCHPAYATLLVLEPNGRLKRTIATDLIEGHGITIVKEGNTEYLWIADTGMKRTPESNFQYPVASPGPRVVKMTLGGQIVAELARPSLPIYEAGKYTPTWVAVNEESRGGNGDVWVTDGYGSSVVHRFNAQGEYLTSIDGTEGPAGHFSCPHSIWLDRRKGDPELYVADRANNRLQIYDLDGHFKRVVGVDFFVTPTGFAQAGDALVVIELRARMTILDAEDRLVTHLGANPEVCTVDGWPNVKNADGIPVRTNLLRPGYVNSPHGIAADRAGNLYLSEWLIGGRYTKLQKI
ncbi:MAG TPA: 6-bladed beta-propeller [Chloroflexota bacterium]|nr:6-bladed beta-propeller [Chloroflexota bacterium]